MNYPVELDKNHLHIFHESKKRRVFVGQLVYKPEEDIYEFTYDIKYSRSKKAISIGPEFSITQLHHHSEKGKLFPSLIDRIPSKANPAYKDYCESQGISPNENNSIVLLGSIGKRGPSSFVFEPVYQNKFGPVEIKNFRNQLKITQHDFAAAFDINKLTLQRIESNLSHDKNTLKLIQIFLQFPEAALWQLKLTGNRVHIDVLRELIDYFLSQITQPH